MRHKMTSLYDKLRKRLREAHDGEDMWFQRAYDLERELYRANKRIVELESKLIEEQQNGLGHRFDEDGRPF